MKTRSHFTVLVSLLALGTACQQSEPDTAAAAPIPPTTAGVQAPTNPTPTSERRFFVTPANEEANTGEVILTAISIIKPHKAVLRLYDLKPGASYEVHFRLFNQIGQEVFHSPRSFTADEPQITLSSEPPTKINHHEQKPGKYTWTAVVKGGREFSIPLTVLPMSQLEAVEQARYERATAEVLNVLFHYWKIYRGDYFTKIFHRDVRYETVKTTEIVDTRTGTIYKDGEQIKIPHDAYDIKERQVIRTNEIRNEFICYLRTRHFTWSFSQNDSFSEADKLNGYTYRGAASFGFTVYQTYEPKGWNDWRDSSDRTSLLSKLFGPGLPEELEKKLNLSFSYVERDGNWTVTASNGDRFVNGKRVTETGEFDTKRPSNEDLLFITEHGPTPGREADRIAGDAIRSNDRIEKEIEGDIRTLQRQLLIR